MVYMVDLRMVWSGLLTFLRQDLSDARWTEGVGHLCPSRTGHESRLSPKLYRLHPETQALVLQPWNDATHRLCRAVGKQLTPCGKFRSSPAVGFASDALNPLFIVT